MKVLVMFPKASCYVNKSFDVQRIYRSNFKEWIKFLVDNNCSIEYMLEDSLAKEILKEMNVNASCITCVCPSDIQFFANQQGWVDIPDYVYAEYSSAVQKIGDVEKKLSVPFNMLREGNEVFLNKKAECCKKRIRTATEAYVRGSKNVLMFSTNAQTNRCTGLSEQAAIGDGRLLMEFYLEKGFINCYYGGTYLPQEYLIAVIQNSL